MEDKKRIGKMGEEIAVKFLKKKGYRILERNFLKKGFSIPLGEIDIISEKNQTISFVEIKTSLKKGSENILFPPEKRVNFLKQKKIIKTAQKWLLKNKIPLEKKYQIDIIAIIIDLENKKAKIKHFENITPGL